MIYIYIYVIDVSIPANIYMHVYNLIGLDRLTAWQLSFYVL